MPSGNPRTATEPSRASAGAGSATAGALTHALAVVARSEGLYVPALDLYLDPNAPVARAFVSHAHGDHVASADGALALASRETAALVRARFGLATSHPLEWGEPFVLSAPIGPCELTVVPAGHVLDTVRAIYAAQLESGHREEPREEPREQAPARPAKRKRAQPPPLDQLTFDFDRAERGDRARSR